MLCKKRKKRGSGEWGKDKRSASERRGAYSLYVTDGSEAVEPDLTRYTLSYQALYVVA